LAIVNKIQNIKLQENLSGGSRVVLSGRTVGRVGVREAANSGRLELLCESV